MDRSEEQTFGAFIREKRKEKEITLRKFAELTGLSPVHMSSMETGQRPAPRDEVLIRMGELLGLDKPGMELLYDLAAISKNAPRVSGDLPDYIMGNDLARLALRTAKEVDATDEEWEEFIAKLRERNREGGG
jgi:transcriptional regulator with XRE-family HTH domain